MGTIAAILLFIVAAAHIVYGEKVQIPRLKKETSDGISIGSVRVMIWQGGVLLLFTGLLQLLSAVGAIELLGMAAFIPIALVSINLVTFLIIAAIKHGKLIATAIPQLVIFAAIIVLQAVPLF